MAITITPIGGEGSQYKIDGLPEFILDKTADDLTKALNKLTTSLDKNNKATKNYVDSMSGRGKGSGGVGNTFEDAKKTANEFSKSLKGGNKQTTTFIDNMRLTNAQSMYNIKSFGKLAASAGAASAAIAGLGFSLLGMAIKYSTAQVQKFAGVLEASMQNGTLFALAVDDFATRLATESTAMGMSFDEVVGVLNTFGEVTVLGAENFTKLLRLTTEINSPLIKLGMTSAEAAELIGRETQFRINQIGLIDVANKTHQDALIESGRRAVEFSQALGMSVTEFTSLRHNAIQSADAIIGLARGTETFRFMQLNAITRFADEMIRRGGQAGGELASAFIDAAGKGALGFSDAAVGFVRALPQLNGVFKEVVDGMRTGNLDVDKAVAILGENLINQSDATSQRLFILARAGDQSATQLIQLRNAYERSQKTIAGFDYGIGSTTKETVERYSQFNKTLESVRSMFGNFAIQMFSSTKFLDHLNKALNNVILMLIPGANVKGNFTETLIANAEKIREAAEDFGDSLGKQLVSISEGVQRFLESFYSPVQKEQAAKMKEAQERKAIHDKEIETVKAALKNQKFRDENEQKNLQDRLANLQQASDREAAIIDQNSANLPGVFDMLGETIVKVIGIFEQLADKLMYVIGVLGALALGPVIGPLFRGGKFLANKSMNIGNRGAPRTPIPTTNAGLMDKRTSGYKNLSQTARNTASKGPIRNNMVRMANSSNPAMKMVRGAGPLGLAFSGFDLATDYYSAFSGDPKEMMGADLIRKYEAQAEAAYGTAGTAIGGLGFFLGPLGFVTTAAGQMLGDTIGDWTSWSADEIDNLRGKHKDPNRYKQILTDKFIVPFGMTADKAISTASENFADTLIQSITAEDAYIDQEISSLLEQVSQGGDIGRQAKKKIEALQKRKDAMFRESAKMRGIDLDQQYEQGSEKYKIQQAILNAQREDNATDGMDELQKQTYYLRKSYLLAKFGD